MSLLSGMGSLITKARQIGQTVRASKRGQQALIAGKAALPVVGAGLAGAGLMGLAQGSAGVGRRRRSRGITARDYRTTQRTLRKISKMYAKLPKRTSHRAPVVRGGGRRTEIVNVD